MDHSVDLSIPHFKKSIKKLSSHHSIIFFKYPSTLWLWGPKNQIRGSWKGLMHLRSIVSLSISYLFTYGSYCLEDNLNTWKSEVHAGSFVGQSSAKYQYYDVFRLGCCSSQDYRCPITAVSLPPARRTSDWQTSLWLMTTATRGPTSTANSARCRPDKSLLPWALFDVHRFCTDKGMGWEGFENLALTMTTSFTGSQVAATFIFCPIRNKLVQSETDFTSQERVPSELFTELRLRFKNTLPSIGLELSVLKPGH